MSQERRFIEASVCLVVLLPSLARVASVVELGDGGGGGVGGGVWGGGRTTKNVLTKVCCLPSFHQILDSRAIALVTIQTIVLSQQLNTSFVLQKLIPYVSNTKCLAARRRRWSHGRGGGSGGGGGEVLGVEALGCIICEETFYWTFGDKKKKKKKKEKRRRRRRRRPRGLKQLIQDPDINSPILWQLEAEIKMLVLLGTAGDSWALFWTVCSLALRAIFSQSEWNARTQTMYRRENGEMGNEQFGLFAQQKGSHNGRPHGFPMHQAS